MIGPSLLSTAQLGFGFEGRIENSINDVYNREVRMNIWLFRFTTERMTSLTCMLSLPTPTQPL